MLVICANCKARLQLDEGKIPPHAFKVRCPKCQASIEVNSAAVEGDVRGSRALPPDVVPPTQPISAFERPPVAAPFKPAAAETAPTGETPAIVATDVAKLLAELLSQRTAPTSAAKLPAWARRKALICTDESHRAVIANGLAEQDYEVFVAENTPEALGRMRADRIAVLVVDADFDPAEQGFAFVMRELKLMRPAERRRLFLVYLTPNVRTMDLHAAFLQNANLVINPADLERIPEALEVSLRHYNELYREVNRVLELAPI
jgi:predicted Zn finger-like uncharacterized protein